MRYLSVCSGIEAASVAWGPLGWECAGVSEIEAFPAAVLAHRFPGVRNFGDFTTIKRRDLDGPIDLLVGGTPCQSFSVAGLRGGLADDRGNLALEFLRLARRTRARWLVWENVSGVLSSGGGRDFGAILGGLAELGYGWAYRILDAQYFGVPQRRRRVFVVGHLGDWRRAAAVLFERHCLSGYPPPSREAGERVAPTISARPSGGGGLGTDFECDVGLTHALTGEGFDASEDGTGRGTPLISMALNAKGGSGRMDAESETLIADTVATLDASYGRLQGCSGQDAKHGHSHLVAFGWDKSPAHTAHRVRRFTPVECEFLMGLPRDWTRIPWRGKPAEECPDGPRYRAIGNSMAVPVMRWIGERIAAADAIKGGSHAG